MKGAWTDFAVGAVFFLAMSALGYATIFKATRFGPTKTYQVRFPKVYGLKEGSQVRCEGKEVGEVKALKLIENYVLAVLEVSADVEIYTAGSKINVTPFSPLGGRVVEITRGRPETPKLDIAALKNNTPDMNQPILHGYAEVELLNAIGDLLAENRPKIDNIFSNLETASQRVTEKNNLIGKVLNDEDFADRVDKMATHLEDATGSISNISKRIDDGQGLLGELTVDDQPIQRHARGALKNAEDALGEIRDIGKKANEGPGVVNSLLADKDLDDDFKGTVANISSVTDTIAEGDGIMRLFSEPVVYENIRDLTGEGREIARKINNPEAGLAGRLISDPSLGDDFASTLDNLDSLSSKLNSKDAGVVGALTSDEQLAETTRKIIEETGRVIKEFRDSIEDIREQAPVNAFLGTAFSAF